MGRLTTHVLDLDLGRPGRGIRVDCWRLEDGARRLLDTRVTNDDGRLDRPMLEGAGLAAGVHELVFHAGPYLRAQGRGTGEPPFLDEIVLRFGIATPDQHYHVPLLLSAHGYSTYRGS